MILGYDEIQCYMSGKERKHVVWNSHNMTFLDLACFSHFRVLKPVSKLQIFIYCMLLIKLITNWNMGIVFTFF